MFLCEGILGHSMFDQIVRDYNALYLKMKAFCLIITTYMWQRTGQIVEHIAAMYATINHMHPKLKSLKKISKPYHWQQSVQLRHYHIQFRGFQRNMYNLFIELYRKWKYIN